MLDEINAKINKIKNDMAEKNILENKLKDLNKELYINEEKLMKLEIQLKKELKDVENLKKLSLSSFMSIVLRNKEEKMQKEEQEYLMAKIKYDECKSRVMFLKNDIGSIGLRIKSLDDCEKEYTQLLQAKVDLINTYGNEDIKNNLENMESDIDSHLKEIKELEESILAGNSLFKEIKCCKKLLSSAQNWGSLDLLGGDLVTSMAKHKKVEEAQQHFSRISNLLYNFNKELGDVNVEALNFSSTTVTFDIFFDNIFTDISVNRKIDESYNNICNLELKVGRVLSALKEEESKLHKIVKNKRDIYDEFVNNI